MHMPNELLSVPVAVGCFGLSAVGVGLSCRSAEKNISQEKMPLMGLFGAFIFAAQMVNFPLPFPPGASGHLTGAVFLAITLGPSAAVVVMTSVVIIQCLIFQDGGLLALGANIINMAILPSFVGYSIYRFIVKDHAAKGRLYFVAIAAATVSTVLAAASASIQTAVSGVLAVPFGHFLGAMCGIHLVIGIIEGVITASLLVYIRKARPGLFDDSVQCETSNSRPFIATVVVAVLITGTCLSLLASEKPDGLEYAIENGDETAAIENSSPAIASVDGLQDRLSPMPDYSRRASTDTENVSAGWTSFAAVIGSIMTMILVWLLAKLMRGRESCKCTMR